MELKEGYKNTDIGVLPEEWSPKSYGDIFQFLSTASFSREQLSDDEDIKCVHYGDIHTKLTHFINFQAGYSSSIDYEKGKRYPFLKDGDIIMADASEDYSGVGKSVEVINLGNQLAISGLHTILLRDKNNEFVDGFRGYIHTIYPVKKSLDRLATGLKVYSVSKGNLKTILIPVPPKPEQQAIATALCDIDKLITNLDKLIAKKKAIKQGAMQQLLKAPDKGGKRLPGFEGEWIKTTIGQIAKISTGRKNTQDRVDGGKYPFFVRSQIVERINSYSFEAEGILTAGDGVGTGKVFHYVNEKIDIHQRVYLISDFKPSIDGYFLFLIFKENFYDRIMSMTAKSSVDSVRKEMITGMSISVPPTKEEQQEIASILLDMDTEIENLESKKSKYLLIKQGMMQELLTGKTRII